MSYTETQILAAKKNAKLRGIKKEVTEEQAIKFLDWYFANRSDVTSLSQAIAVGVYQLSENGIQHQEQAWRTILGD